MLISQVWPKPGTTYSLSRDRRVIGELLSAGDDDPIPRLEAIEHGIVVAGDWTHLDRPLFRDQARFAVGSFGFLGHEREVLAVDAEGRGHRDDDPFAGFPDNLRPNRLGRTQCGVGIA